MNKRLVALLLCLVMAATALAGCGGGNTTSSAPAPTPAPTATPEPYDPDPLTGEAKGADYVSTRPVAIMINNIAQSRPQRGLNDASVLYEIMVEGGITRFMGLFGNYEALGDVGPVRSARDQFFRLIMPFQPLYVHIGRSGITQQYIDDSDYGNLNVDGDAAGKIIYRDKTRLSQGFNYEHTAYTTGELLSEYVKSNDIDMSRGLTSPIFDFVDYREPARTLNGQDALSVGIVHSSSYRTYFDYDAVSNQYQMSQYNSHLGAITETADENTGERTSFDNVLVLFTEITTYPYPGGNIDPKTGLDKGDPDYKKVDYDFGGVGYYINGGKAEKIRWTKGATQYALMLQDENGNSLKINRGRSYVAVVSLDEYDNFKIEGADGNATNDSVSVDPNAAQKEANAENAAE